MFLYPIYTSQGGVFPNFTFTLMRLAPQQHTGGVHVIAEKVIPFAFLLVMTYKSPSMN